MILVTRELSRGDVAIIFLSFSSESTGGICPSTWQEPEAEKNGDDHAGFEDSYEIRNTVKRTENTL